MLYPCRHTWRPASTQSNVVDWKNFVDLKERNRYLKKKILRTQSIKEFESIPYRVRVSHSNGIS